MVIEHREDPAEWFKKKILNRLLQQLEHYEGSVGAVELHLNYNFQIFNAEGDNEESKKLKNKNHL